MFLLQPRLQYMIPFYISLLLLFYCPPLLGVFVTADVNSRWLTFWEQWIAAISGFFQALAFGAAAYAGYSLNKQITLLDKQSEASEKNINLELKRYADMLSLEILLEHGSSKDEELKAMDSYFCVTVNVSIQNSSIYSAKDVRLIASLGSTQSEPIEVSSLLLGTQQAPDNKIEPKMYSFYFPLPTQETNFRLLLDHLQEEDQASTPLRLLNNWLTRIPEKKLHLPLQIKCFYKHTLTAQSLESKPLIYMSDMKSWSNAA